MSDPIAEYQEWKKQGGDLRTRAKQAIETRFRELLTEAVHLAEEYRTDFGTALALPAPVTAFRYKAGAKKAAAKKTAAGKGTPAAAAPAAPAAPKGAPAPVAPTPKASSAAPKAAPAPAAPAGKPDAKTVALEKQLAGARKKLEAATAKGAPTKNLEDRVYELEDDLRLATQGV